jgi:hypothetical protein
MQKIFLVGCLFSLISLASAQNNNVYTSRSARDIYAKAPGYIGVYGNYSILFNTQLTATEYSDKTAGFAANAGWGGGVRGAFFVGKNFGFGGTAFYNTYGTQGATKLAEGYRIANRVDSATVLQTGGYQQIGALVGPTFTFPAKHLSFDIHAFGGMINTTTPETQVFLRKNASPSLSQARANTLVFGWQAGAALRVRFTKFVSMNFFADYTASQPTLNFQNSVAAGFLGRKLDDYSQNISTINTGVGFFVEFPETRWR